MMDQMMNFLLRLLPFLKITLIIAVSSMIVGLVWGGILASMKIGGGRVLRKIAEFYTTVIRCTPVILLLFLSYYGIPVLLKLVGIDVSHGSKIVFAIIALSMYSSAILSEIIRPAYLAVNHGQYEAAVMSGLSHWQAIWHIIVPQAFYIALPNMGNMIIALVRQSSLAFLIGVVDVMGQAKVINSTTYSAHVFEIYFVVSLIYWVIILLIGKGVDFWTYRLGKILR